MKQYVFYLLVVLFIPVYAFAGTVEFECEKPVLLYNDHVGNNWNFNLEIAGKDCPIGGTVKIESTETILIIFNAREMDKVIDFGNNTFEIDPAALEPGKELFTDIEVVVAENRGKYSGNTAKWRIRVYYRRL